MAIYIAREASKVSIRWRLGVRWFAAPVSYSGYGLLSFFFSSIGLLQLWRKVCAETSVELQLLFEKWHLLLAGIVFQVNLSIYFVELLSPKYQTIALLVGTSIL